MKKLLSLFLASFLSVCTIEAAVNSDQSIPNQFVTPDDPPSSNKIDLHGNIAYNTSSYSIEAFVCKNSVQICFHQNFGYVNITLLNETGSVVYNNTVNTAVQQTFYIPLSGTSSGNYTLVLDNANGYAEGEFTR